MKINKKKNPSLIVKKCKFNTNLQEILKIHNTNVHEPTLHRCDQCNFCIPSETMLKLHKKKVHSPLELQIVIKKSLNLIEGEEGGLSDTLSNPKRGQANIFSEHIINDILKSVVLHKRDLKSTNLGSNYQELKKKSTNVDKKPGSNFQENKTKYLNLIKGEAGSLSNPVSVQSRGQAGSMCKLIINDIMRSITFNKRDKESTKPGSNVQDNKKRFH